MKIAVYLPFITQKRFSANEQLVLELLTSIIYEKQEHLFVFLCPDQTGFSLPASNNVETVFLKTGILKKIWWKIYLPRLFRKNNIDMFFCCDPQTTLSATIKQVYLITDKDKTKPANLKNARSLIVMNRAAENVIMNAAVIKKEIIKVLPPSPLADAAPHSSEDNFATKEKYSSGKEYFYYSSQKLSNENFIDLLKAFSHFKKRQQSSFKLLINVSPNSFIEEKIANYKYRQDVAFVSNEENKSLAKICAAAYAVLLPFETCDNSVAAMNAISSGVPVIITADATITEIAADAVLIVEKNNPKDIGDKMIRLYTNENFRSRLIENRKTVTDYNQGFAADQLWQFILDALQ